MDYEHLLRPRTTRVLQQAGFLRRAGAFTIDLLLLDLIVTAPFTPLFAGIMRQVESGNLLSLTYSVRELALVVTVFLVAYAYFVLFEYLLSQTPGMMLLGTVSEPAGRLWQAMVRNSFLLPFFPFMLLWIIEPLAILFFRQGLLEHLSRTRTLYQREVLF